MKLFSLSNFDCLYLRQYRSYEQGSKHRSASFWPEKGFWISSGCHWILLMTHKVLQVKCTVGEFNQQCSNDKESKVFIVLTCYLSLCTGVSLCHCVLFDQCRFRFVATSSSEGIKWCARAPSVWRQPAEWLMCRWKLMCGAVLSVMCVRVYSLDTKKGM
jgi:hypothetical protein